MHVCVSVPVQENNYSFSLDPVLLPHLEKAGHTSQLLSSEGPLEGRVTKGRWAHARGCFWLQWACLTGLSPMG